MQKLSYLDVLKLANKVMEKSAVNWGTVGKYALPAAAGITGLSLLAYPFIRMATKKPKAPTAPAGAPGTPAMRQKFRESGMSDKDISDMYPNM